MGRGAPGIRKKAAKNSGETVKSSGGLSNLKPFKKGESGNPKGRPPKLPNLDVLGAKLLSEEKNGITLMEALIRSVANKALKGDVRAAEALLDRFYGKAKQSMDITSKGESIIQEVDYTKLSEAALKEIADAANLTT